MAMDWAADVKKYAPDADDGVIASIVRYCGIALRNVDSSLVSFSDPTELARMRSNYLQKKLGLTEADSVLDAAIAKVGDIMKADRTKNRVTVYYLLAAEFSKLGMFAPKGKVAPIAAPAPAAKSAAAKTPAADAPAAKTPAKAAAEPVKAEPSVGATRAAGAAAAGTAGVAALAGLNGAKATKPAAKKPAAKPAPVMASAAKTTSSSEAPSTNAAAPKPAPVVTPAPIETQAPAPAPAAAPVPAPAPVAKVANVPAAATSAAAPAAVAATAAAAPLATSAAAKPAPAAPRVMADDDSKDSSLGWLWWLLGLALLIFAAWWLFGRGDSADDVAPASSAETSAAAGAGAGMATDGAAGAAVTDLAAAPAEGTVTIPTGSGVTAETRDSRPVVKVYFDSGKTAVAPAFAGAAGGLKAWLDGHAGSALQVSGYNDPTGNAAKNAELSKNRAQAVAAELVKAGIPEGSVELVKPEATTDSTVSKEAARRVEVTVK